MLLTHKNTLVLVAIHCLCWHVPAVTTDALAWELKYKFVWQVWVWQQKTIVFNIDLMCGKAGVYIR